MLTWTEMNQQDADTKTHQIDPSLGSQATTARTSMLVDCLPTFLQTGIAAFLFLLALLALMEPDVFWWALAQLSPEHPVAGQRPQTPRAHPRRPRMYSKARRQGERRPHGKRHLSIDYDDSSSDSDCAGDDTRLSVLDPFERPRHRTDSVPERRRIVRRPVHEDDDDLLTPSQASQQRQLAARQVDFTDANTWDFISSITIPEIPCPFTPPILERHAEGPRSAKPDVDRPRRE